MMLMLLAVLIVSAAIAVFACTKACLISWQLWKQDHRKKVTE